jgi:hypothetical protein
MKCYTSASFPGKMFGERKDLYKQSLFVWQLQLKIFLSTSNKFQVGLLIIHKSAYAEYNSLMLSANKGSWNWARSVSWKTLWKTLNWLT